MIANIQRMYIRRYSDNGQRTLYIDWIDGKGRSGRTECDAELSVRNEHMRALVARGQREGLRLENETW